MALQQQHTKMTPEEICRIFTETALKPDKCVDFDIKYWIEKYDLVRREPKFAEIAMLIMSAAQIYGRKVDYVEEFILNLCKSFSSLDESTNKDGSTSTEALLAAAAAAGVTENRPKRRTKRMRPEMLSEKLIRTEYVPKKAKIATLAKLSEKISLTLEDDAAPGKKVKPAKRSLKQDVLQWKLNFPDEQGKTKPRAAKLKIEEEELYSRYTNFGKTYLYDYEDDDVIGVKKDFKAFAGYIDPVSNALLSDLNMRKFYKLQEEAENEPFDEESMNQECNFLEDTRGGSPCRNTFFDDCPSMDVDEDIDPIASDLSQNTTSEESSKNAPSDLSTTLETSLANASHSTELNSSSEGNNSTLDLSSRVIPQIMIKSKISLKVEPELKLNILGLPEKMLRRKAIFTLPKEVTRKPVTITSVEEDPAKEGDANIQSTPSSDFVFESGIIMGSPAKKPAKEKLFVNLSEDLKNIPTPPPSPIPEDEEDFLGFDETPEFNDSSVFSSTLARLSLDSNMFLTPKVARTMSQDSGFLTPPASLRFSCDEANPSDLDSGLGASSIEDDLMSPPKEKTIEADVVTPDPVEEDLPVELTEKHRKLQDQAEKRHQERLEANIDVTVEVNKWHAHLKPILRASHARANFDIHELGTEILNSFPGDPPKVNDTITFADVVAEKEQPDVCRYFLSTLLLANTENIRLSVGRKANDQVTEYKDMELAFLSAERHYQEINEMYDTEGMINTNVKKRMRECDEEEVVVEERTPKKQKISKKKVAKVVESSPADSGYMSGFEEAGPSFRGISPVSRKRSISGELVVNKKGKLF